MTCLHSVPSPIHQVDGNDDINSTISPIRVDPPPHTHTQGSDVILHLVKTIKFDVELAQVRTGFKTNT